MPIVFVAIIRSVVALGDYVGRHVTAYGQDKIIRQMDYQEWEGPFVWTSKEVQLIGEHEHAFVDQRARTGENKAYQATVKKLRAEKTPKARQQLKEVEEAMPHTKKRAEQAVLQSVAMESSNKSLSVLMRRGQKRADKARSKLEPGVTGSRWS